MNAVNGQHLQAIVGVFEQSGDMHMITDCTGVIEYVNPAFEAVTGFGKDEVIGKMSLMLESRFRPDDAFFSAAMLDTLKTGKAFKGVLANRKRNGEMFYEETTISPIRDAAGNITHLFATGRDVTKNMRELDKLQQLANFDSLTELPNRNLLMDRLQQALSHTARRMQQVALIYLDMDDFKQVNDLYGHAVGDELLQAVALRLKSCVRQEDTVARLCGDEFVVILANIKGIDSVLNVLDKIIYSFRQSTLLGERCMQASCSIGVSIYPRDGEEISELLRCADIAMYRTKAEGGNGYSFYCAEDEADSGTAAGQRSALAQQDFFRERMEGFHARCMPMRTSEMGSA